MSPRRSAASAAATATALGAMLLAGCVSPARKGGAEHPGPGVNGNDVDMAADWPARRAALLAQKNFAMQGRVGIVAGQEGFSATLRWSQRAQRGEMQLAGPLGVGALNVEYDADNLRVSDSHGVTLSGAAARAELERRLGFALPLSQLRFWARGVPAPSIDAGDAGASAAATTAAAATETLDAAGQRLTALEQEGWRMNYTAYAPSLLGVLPQKLELARPGVRIRLVIQKWDAP